MRVFVTGGAGFIGSHLADALLAAGHEVAVLDDLSSGRRELVDPRCEFVEADLAAPAVAAFVERWRPDALAHLAAHVSVRESVADPLGDAQTNVVGSLALLAACHAAGVRRVVFSSTGGGMFSDGQRLPTPESERPSPASPYGCAKLAIEGYLGYYARVHGVTGCALRYANVYGPRQSPHSEAGVVAIFAEAFLRGEAPTIYGDGTQTRDYVYVDDVVRATAAALETGLAGVFHVGTGVQTSTAEIAELLRQAAGARAPARHASARTGDATRSALDATALSRALGWRPALTLAEGLRRTVASLREP